MKLNLETNSREQELVKSFLEENVSVILANKINEGVPIELDGKPLISKKDLDGFFSFASQEAKKNAAKNAKSACVEDKTVYGWAIHYFEEDSIQGKLYYYDGEEYKTDQKAKQVTVKKESPKVETNYQFSLFDSPQNPSKEEPINSTIFDKGTDAEEELHNSTIFDKDSDVEEDLHSSTNIDKDLAIESDCNEGNYKVEREPAVDANTAQKAKISPIYKEYLEVKEKYPDAIIAYRLGDFYEFFAECAVVISDELDLTLTGREFGLEKRVPLCGIPYHAAELYFHKIVSKHQLVILEDGKTEEYCIKQETVNHDGQSYEKLNKLKALFGDILKVQL